MKKTIFFAVLIVGGLISLLVYNSIKSKERLLSKSDEIFYEAFKRYPNMIASNTRGEATNSKLSKVMAKYDKEKYSEALKEFNTHLKENPDDYQVKFYRGLTYLHLEKPQKAINDLKKVLDNNQEFVDESKWYLALAYVKINRIDKASPLLDELVADNGSKSGESKMVLEKLN